LTTESTSKKSRIVVGEPPAHRHLSDVTDDLSSAESFEPTSNVTYDKLLHERKQLQPRVSRDEGIQIDESDEHPQKTKSIIRESVAPARRRKSKDCCNRGMRSTPSFRQMKAGKSMKVTNTQRWRLLQFVTAEIRPQIPGSKPASASGSNSDRDIGLKTESKQMFGSNPLDCPNRFLQFSKLPKQIHPNR
jgi:hypothetical protein